MPQFSETSKARLETCHTALQHLFHLVVARIDIAIIYGHRGEREQNQAFEQGLSKLRWPHSKHNQNPSLAVDVSPWPIDWNAREDFCLLAGWVLREASEHGISLRWGGDWNGNMRVRDESFLDMAHFELV